MLSVNKCSLASFNVYQCWVSSVRLLRLVCSTAAGESSPFLEVVRWRALTCTWAQQDVIVTFSLPLYWSTEQRWRDHSGRATQFLSSLTFFPGSSSVMISLLRFSFPHTVAPTFDFWSRNSKCFPPQLLWVCAEEVQSHPHPCSSVIVTEQRVKQKNELWPLWKNRRLQ